MCTSSASLVVTRSFTGRAQVATRDLAFEGNDVVFHLLGEANHLLAARRQRVAGTAALEQTRSEPPLDLSQPTKHGGVVHRQFLGRKTPESDLGRWL